MAEVLSWREGIATFTTGGSTPILAYAQNMNVSITRGWNNRMNVAGTYVDRLTGQRADVSIEAFFTYDATILRMSESASTAVFLTLNQSALGASAGYRFTFGCIDTITLRGSEGNPYVYGITYHSNSWTAWGSTS